LDGTLLDQDTYGYEASLPTLRRLLGLRIPVALCSSKTHAEMKPLWDELGLRDPFIVENGGAIYIPPGYFPFQVTAIDCGGGWKVVELGRNISALRGALSAASRHCGVSIRSFGDMGPAEIAALTGLTLTQAERASLRAYDEPFLFEGNNPSQLLAWLAGQGFDVIKGDRFYHVTGGHDKGRATRILMELYRRVDAQVSSVGLGNSANDLALLQCVDSPLLIRNPDGSWDAVVQRRIPRIRRSEKVGPSGWSEVLEALLDCFPGTTVGQR
jgi:mannosyl-3-phosphoglycerate phosphatase